ncbi:hypothetical protein KEHDKFFH_16710 [Marinobacter maroccanus]|uniref:Curli production assembly/transport component CsgG n=1 Tax=Marinobacter maroccanus TaxID=2055143 RepID=A0A2S5Z6I6_9GAMM|nr:hypothetical protein [Marinobacter maroccanus]PPI82931.1 hypothetical protein KEHDKFFH_16710 [Marinobacter maroccanus]
MRSFRFLFVLLVLALSGCSSLSPQETQLAVKELVNQVQVAVNTIRAESDSSSVLPELKTAELKISSKAERGYGGKVALFVSGGGSRDEAYQNSITIILEPMTQGQGVKSKGLGNDIAESVLAAVSGLEELEGLQLKSMTVVAGLEIIETIEGGIEYELAGISLGADGSKALTTGNSLKLVFEDTEKNI